MVYRLHIALFSMLLAATGAVAQEGGSWARAAKNLESELARQPDEIFWQSEVLSKDDVQSELAKFYLTLQENSVLQTKEVLIEKGDTPTDLMIRHGVWPHWLEGRMPLNVEAMLCALNATICRPSKSANVASNWSRAWPGETLHVPSIKLTLDYRFGVREIASLQKSVKKIDFVTTTQLEELWCRQSGRQHSICRDGTISKGWQNEQPAVYVYAYDPNEDLNRFESILDKQSLKQFGTQDSALRIVAVPIIKATVETASEQIGSVFRTIRQLDEKAFVNPVFSTESSVAEGNARTLSRMGFLKGFDYLPPYEQHRGPTPIRIAHIDTEAELNHCMFSSKVRMKRWNFSHQELETIDPAEVEVVSNTHSGGTGGDGNAQPNGMGHMRHCGDFNEGALEQVSHGTHTLGLLVDILTLGGNIKMQPGADDPPVTIYHIPIGQEEPNEFQMDPFIEVLEMLRLWRVDVVSMSVSWNQADTKAMEETIKRLDESIFFVAAAGNQGQSEGCSKSPACIKSKNVISVIGLDLDSEDHIRLLPDTNRGAKFHDIGAFGGNIISAVNEGMVGRFSGTSQAAPIVAAAIGQMIQRGQGGVDNIYEHLLTTAWLDSGLLGASKATMINVQRALDIGTDFLELKDGCAMKGKFDRFVGNPEIAVTPVETGNSNISSVDIRRMFYNERDDWYLVMHKSDGEFESAGYLLDDQSQNRTIRFKPEVLDHCEGNSLASGATHTFKISDIKDLILTSL